jgi:hypothetical protein
MKISIDKLTLQKVFEVSRFLKKETGEIFNTEDTCQKLAESIYRIFSDSKGKSEFALCRIFKSCSFDDFPSELKKYVCDNVQKKRFHDIKYLTLLGTFGDKNDWRSITKSKSHRVIPLSDHQSFQQRPLMSALFGQIGFNIPQPQDSGALEISKIEDQNFGYFLVKEAEGNPLILDQDGFVIPFGIKSIFGFGGMFSTGNIFTAMMFSKKCISIEKAGFLNGLASAFKFVQIESELKGLIFKGTGTISENSTKREGIELEVEKEKKMS